MDRSHQPQQQPTPAQQPAPLAPRPNRILAEPATVAACYRDYALAASIRARMDRGSH